MCGTQRLPFFAGQQGSGPGLNLVAELGDPEFAQDTTHEQVMRESVTGLGRGRQGEGAIYGVRNWSVVLPTKGLDGLQTAT